MKESFLSRLRRILWFSARRFVSDGHSYRAVALTYYTIFAIVPAAALCFGIAKGFDLDVKLRNELMRYFSSHKEIMEWICRFADTTLQQAQGGIVAGVGVIVLIWTVVQLASHVERAFNDVWALPQRKNILRRFTDYLSIILLTPLLVVVVGASGVALRGIFTRFATALPGISALNTTFSVLADFTPLLISCLLFSAIYKMVPNTRVHWGGAVLAGIFAGIFFQVLQDGFLLLQGTIFRYNRIYGTFAVLPLFLVWLQWAWQIVLFGAEIGFVAQNIGTGLFNGTVSGRGGSRMHRTAELAAAAFIYREFASGKGGVSLREIVNKLNLPESLLEGEIRDLVECGAVNRIFSEENELKFSPGQPTETFTAADCIALLEGAQENCGEENSGTAHASRLLRIFDASLASGKSNVLLKEL